MILLAHAGHWLVQVLYVLPLAVMGVLLVRGWLRDRSGRRKRRQDAPPGTDA